MLGLATQCVCEGGYTVYYKEQGAANYRDSTGCKCAYAGLSGGTFLLKIKLY